MAADLVTPGHFTDRNPSAATAEENGQARRSTEPEKVANGEQVASSSEKPEDGMMTKEAAAAGEVQDGGQDAAGVDIQQLLQKYGQVQNQFMFMDDTKKRYNKEGFRIRFRLSRAYRGLEKQEILASRPEVSSMNGPKRKKALQKLMQQLEQNLMLFDPDEDAKRKAQEREVERQKLLKECRENVKKKWKNDGEQKSAQVNVGKRTGSSKSPTRASQHMAEYWGKPVQKKGREPKGDWRVKQKNGEKPWWHKFTKKKKPKITWGENASKDADDGVKMLEEGEKQSDNGEEYKDGTGSGGGGGGGDRRKVAAEKFFITNPGSQSDSYSAVEEWQRRNAERKGRKAERMTKLKQASRSTKAKKQGKMSAGDRKKGENKSDKEKSSADNSTQQSNGLNGESTATASASDSKNDENVERDPAAGDAKKEGGESHDAKTPEELEEEQLMEKSKYSFMAFGGFSSFSQKSCKSSASSVTSASSARSEEEFDVDDAEKNRLDMLLRAQSNAASGSRVGSREGSKAGSTVSKHVREQPARATGRPTQKQTRQNHRKPAVVSHPKSVTFKADQQDDDDAAARQPRIEVHDADGNELETVAPVLPGQVTAVKPKDTTVPSKKAAPGILKDAPSTPKLHRTKSAPPSHGHRSRMPTSSLRDDSSSPEAKEEDKPLKICRYMYTMCNCQRVGRPSTLAKLQQRRKKTVGVITVYGCPDEEERKRSTSPTVCPFCTVFPRYRINAWLKDVPVVTVE